MDVEAGTKPGWGTWFRWREQAARTAQSKAAAGNAPASPALHRAYCALVHDCCTQHGLASSELRIEPISLGRSQGREVYVVLMTPARDDSAMALRLTYIAPQIEIAVAAGAALGAIFAQSRFAGVWTHWPSGAGVPPEVRSLLLALRRRGAAEPDQSTTQRGSP